ncbi:MAG TPA: hypothetical protein GX505_02860 [Clostridiales bacterium]|nr:hypothetical protein [Clostridiales bacterium]
MSYVRYNNANIEIVNSAGKNVMFDGKGGYDGKFNGKADCRVESVDVKPLVTESSENFPEPIAALGSGAVAKVPVVLAQLTVQANVNSVIKLPEYAFEIKRIKKNVKVTQCLLIQDTNILFIKGFVRKNIEYSTRESSNAEGFCGDIKHCTVDVPFNLTTAVNFNGIEPVPPIANTSTEFQYQKEEEIHHPDFSEKDKLLSGDLREFNQISTEYFNELPYCDLVSARIVEFDEQLMPEPLNDKYIVTPFEEKRFRRIEEKMVIFITLRLLQKRLVAIPSVAGAAEDRCPRKE